MFHTGPLYSFIKVLLENHKKFVLFFFFFKVILKSTKSKKKSPIYLSKQIIDQVIYRQIIYRIDNKLYLVSCNIWGGELGAVATTFQSHWVMILGQTMFERNKGTLVLSQALSINHSDQVKSNWVSAGLGSCPGINIVILQRNLADFSRILYLFRFHYN